MFKKVMKYTTEDGMIFPFEYKIVRSSHNSSEIELYHTFTRPSNKRKVTGLYVFLNDKNDEEILLSMNKLWNKYEMKINNKKGIMQKHLLYCIFYFKVKKMLGKLVRAELISR